MKARLALVVIAVFLGACGPAAEQKPPEIAAEEPSKDISIDATTAGQMGIEVEAVQPRSVSSTITATGLLQLNEERTWRVGSITDGRIASIPVTLGQAVEAGQTVANLHSHEVHDARADQRKALAEVEKWKALLDQARRVRDRTRRLYDLKAASREQLEAAETQFRSTELSVENAETELHRTQTHLTEYLDVPLEDAGENSPDHEQVNLIPIKSPAKGIVIEKLANVGSVVSAASPVVTISDVSSLWLIAAVSETDLSRVRLRQSVEVSVRAYPDRVFRGTVFRLGEKLDPETRSLQVRILVANSNGLLKPEMYANVSIIGAGSDRSLYVPEAAVLDIDGKPTVFVRTDAGTFVPRQVGLGNRSGDQVEIVSGLTSGTSIVTKGAFLLKSHLLKEE